MTAMTVHYTGNSSTCDEIGRLKKFKVETICGLSLSTPRLLSNRKRKVSCRRCLRWFDLVTRRPGR